MNIVLSLYTFLSLHTLLSLHLAFALPVLFALFVLFALVKQLRVKNCSHRLPRIACLALLVLHRLSLIVLSTVLSVILSVVLLYYS